MGQLTRLLIILIALWIAWQLIRRFLRASHSSERPSTPSGQAPRMLPCARCGVHIPEPQAITVGGKAYCSKEHLPG
ncbi:MAG: PP0621 family protein [Sulfurifustaceae bacterium]